MLRQPRSIEAFGRRAVQAFTSVRHFGMSSSHCLPLTSLSHQGRVSVPQSSLRQCRPLTPNVTFASGQQVLPRRTITQSTPSHPHSSPNHRICDESSIISAIPSRPARSGLPLSGRHTQEATCNRKAASTCAASGGAADGPFPVAQTREETDESNLEREACGSIEIIVGPMFSGKTTELLKRVAAERTRGRQVILVKSHVDTRYAEDEVVSHKGDRMKCFAVKSMADIVQLLGDAAYDQVDVIAVDEAQFIQDLEFFVTNAADHGQKKLILAGLDGDFRRRKFGGLVDLVPVADSVTKLKARCQVCSSAAMFTLRKSADMRTEVVGGADLYMPVCRKHFLDGQNMKKALAEGGVVPS